jgi:hypothetical protein
MEPVLTLLAATFFETALKMAGEAVFKPALEKGTEPFREWLARGYEQKKAEAGLQKHFAAAVKKAEFSAEDADLEGDALERFIRRAGLDRVQGKGFHALRESLALAVIDAGGDRKDAPEELRLALGWPEMRAGELADFLTALRAGLARDKYWRPLIEAADRARGLGLLAQAVETLAPFRDAFVRTEEGKAFLRVKFEGRPEYSPAQLAEVETIYRQRLAKEFRWLSIQGLAQLPKAIRLPLREVYLELGLLPRRDEKLMQRDLETEADLDVRERLMHDLKAVRGRVSDPLGKHPRLVIVGKPGSGKTVSLKFITLMMALGESGAARLRLPQVYFPIYARLSDYALALKNNPATALETFLLKHVDDNYPGKTGQDSLLRAALEDNRCLVLLDGLDEVGDVGDTLVHGRTLRTLVLKQVARFADTHCAGGECNRVIVTSRLEGYHGGELPGFSEMELSPLWLPDEVRDFLTRWFSANELEYSPDLSRSEALERSARRVEQLMGDILRSDSIQRLAMNPLLLTILAMIHESGTRLPERRVKLYQIVTATMIETWRVFNVNRPSHVLEYLPVEKLQKILAELAYWLHENYPGGAVEEAVWRERIEALLLDDEDLEDEDRGEQRRRVTAAVETFVQFARLESGLVTERSPGKLGFFHLTLQEYLAAVNIAGKEAERRRIIERHWAQARWQEPILLAAGQMMLNHSDALNTFVSDLRLLEDGRGELAGRPALLAGQVLADVGVENFSRRLVRETKEHLQEVAQELDAEDRGKPSLLPRFSIQVRAQAADLLDGLGWQPRDLYDYLPVKTSDTTVYMSRYPVTNAQYARFIAAPDFALESYWLDFPAFDEACRPMAEGWGEKGLEYLRRYDGKVEPGSWRDPSLGIARPGAPVVAVSWYEANAYCRWLRAHWAGLAEHEKNPAIMPGAVRLPLENEWEAAAGGIDPEGRYPWDGRGQATQEEDEILRRANTGENGLGRTTPVWMYPGGESQHGLRDLAGNVWEWQANYADKDLNILRLRGGSFIDNLDAARGAVHFNGTPNFQWLIGIRVVVLSSSA